MFVEVCTDIIKLPVYRKIKGKKLRFHREPVHPTWFWPTEKTTTTTTRKKQDTSTSGGGGRVGGRGGVTGDLCWAGLVRTGFKNRPVLTVVDRLVMLVSGAAFFAFVTADALISSWCIWKWREKCNESKENCFSLNPFRNQQADSSCSLWHTPDTTSLRFSGNTTTDLGPARKDEFLTIHRSPGF